MIFLNVAVIQCRNIYKVRILSRPMDIATILLLISLIIIVGLFAEYIFGKSKIPDILFLIILGIALGPHFLAVVSPAELSGIAPLFTSITLLFLIFTGALNIDLSSFAKGISFSFVLSLFNFLISSLIVAIVMLIFGYGLLPSVFAGFALGGISSAFVIPLLQKIKVKKDTFSILAIESALTDVLCIVFSLTVLNIIIAQVFTIKTVFESLISLFAIAGLVGIGRP